MRNVLITGTPRSGTTLLCSLLNKLPDTVALHEPMNVWEFPNCADANAIAEVIEAFCTETRKSLHEHGYAMSKHVGGHIPDNVAADQDAIERQLHILEWFYTRFRKILPDRAIIKYEDLVASHGRELAKFFPGAANFDENLSSKNVNKFYDRALMVDLGERLLRRTGVMWDLYSKRDVEALIAEASSDASVTLKP